MNDQEIIALYFARNEQAIEESSLKYGRYLFTVAHRILGNQEDSEECVNDTWLRSWNAIPPKIPEILRLFFAEITRNLAFDRYRQDHAKKRFSGEIALVLDELSETIASPGEDVEDEVLAKELSESINAFLYRQKERDADIFLQRYFFTKPVKEIASDFGMSENHVAVVLKRMREKLKAYLLDEGLIHE